MITGRTTTHDRHTTLRCATSHQTARWLLVWPVMFAVVLFASLNPVVCLIHCAAQGENAPAASQRSTVYLCPAETLANLSQRQPAPDDPSATLPLAVHELVLVPTLVLALGITMLYAIAPRLFQQPFVAIAPPNPPPKLVVIPIS